MEEKFDVLGRDVFISRLKTLVEVVADKKEGCCFGIDGQWGCGKTFALEMFENTMKTIQNGETADNEYFVFHYNCWEYDYYEEPMIAIIASMLDETNKELSTIPEGVKDKAKLAWSTVLRTLEAMASECCKNKIGIDLVETAKNILADHDKVEDAEFDSMYGFKKALEKVRAGIQEIAKKKTVIIVVDELDRCLPAYSIKVLERLHHIFHKLQNVIVIVAMDKKQLEHSIKEIYGDIEVDIYLRKFISFKVKLDKGNASDYIGKYKSYTSMFTMDAVEEVEIETFFNSILKGVDMRTQERIFNKAETIHNIIKEDDETDCSIMTFEILYLTAVLFARSRDVGGLVHAERYHLNNEFDTLFNIIKSYRLKLGKSLSNIQYLGDAWIDKTIFWFASIYNEVSNGYCAKYRYNGKSQIYRNLVEKFVFYMEFIDVD